ncbi:MAG: class I SAM-dependent methyltransferase, partial [Gaiellales bacterium]
MTADRKGAKPAILATMTPSPWGTNRHRKYSRAGWVSEGDMLSAIVNAAGNRAAGGVVIELGCGLGHVAAAFADIAARVVAVDHDENMLSQAHARDHVEYVHSKVELFDHSPVDVVVARNVIHYIGGPLLFEKARNLLRPAGIFLVCQAVPPSTAARPWHDQLHDMMGVARAPNTDDIVAGFALEGFSSIKVTYYFHRMNVTDWV